LVTIDIILILILLWGGYSGYRKGLLMEVVAILALVLAIIGGFKLLHWGMDLLDQHFEISGKLLPYITFIAIFVLIVILVNLLGKSLKTILDMTLIGNFDKFAGALVGILKWGFGLSVVLWLTLSFNITLPEHWIDGSIIYPFLVNFAPKVVEWVAHVLPFASGLFDTIKELLGGS